MSDHPFAGDGVRKRFPFRRRVINEKVEMFQAERAKVDTWVVEQVIRECALPSVERPRIRHLLGACQLFDSKRSGCPMEDIEKLQDARLKRVHCAPHFGSRFIKIARREKCERSRTPTRATGHT